ncbi:MAG: sugar ABC transporter permease [Plantibacter flavus]
MTTAIHLNGAARYRPPWVPLLWCAPALLMITIWSVGPFVGTIALSFTDTSPLGMGGAFVGLDNYRSILQDPAFWSATGNSVLYAVIAVPLLVVLPLLLAQLVHTRLPGMGFFRSAYAAPIVASVVAVGLVWQNLLGEQGPVNTVLQRVGLIQQAVPFLSEGSLILLSAIALTVWRGLGWYLIFYLAALSNIPRELYEAAELDGAGPTRRFLTITVPGTRLTMLLVGLLAGIGSLRVFSEVYLLGGATGGPGGEARTLPFFIRDAALDPITGNAGYGAAASVALFTLTAVFAVLAQRFGGERDA